MTKLRPALSFENALTKVAGVIGWKRAAEIVGHAERTVRHWSDPDTTTKITLDAALKLDVEYRAAGGEGAPFFQCYGLRLEVDTAAACVDAEKRAVLTALAARETGEALQALVMATRPGANAADLALARREAEEAITALSNTLPTLGAGPGSSASPGGRTRKMVSRSGPRLSMDCPHCESKARARTSRVVGPTYKHLNFQCSNLDCGHTFACGLEILYTIAPSAVPNPAIHLRTAPARGKAANDNIGLQVIASAPEVAPPAANDDGRYSEAI